MTRMVELVVKVGGSLAREGGLTERLSVVRDLRESWRAVLVVPGGGAFTDAVRAAAEMHGLSESTAHWMAILGMDQYAHLLAESLQNGALVREPPEIAATLRDGRLPVLAPFQWIRRLDPLPHSWSVSGDSIAAWVAGQLGARKLILLKSRGDRIGVDRYFPKALPSGLDWEAATPESVGRCRVSRTRRRT